MNINRHNYEEYFLLYIDNELSAAERQAVEVFVQANPDLREELRMLEQTVLRPEKKMMFPDKASLIKTSSPANPVNETNYEEYFVLYGDDELSNEEKDNVEQFIYKNPRYQADFELMQKARLTADTSIFFPDKQSLYRSEKDEKIIVIRWWRIAAAAVVILMIGGAALYFSSGSKKTGNPEYATQEKPSTESISNPAIKENPSVQVQPGTEQPFVAQSPATHPSGAEKTNEPSRKEIQPAPIQPAESPRQLYAVNETAPEKKSDNGSNPANGSSVTQETTGKSINEVKPERTETIASVSSIADPEKDFEKLRVNDPKEESTIATYASNDNDRIEVLNTTVSNKGKMRGFFRKVGRVVDRATNFGNSAEKDTDKKGVKIANFEIALK